MRKTLGMLGTGLVTFMQDRLWRGAMKASGEHGARLIFYPAISLSSWPPFPPQPKILLDFIDRAPIDGLLVWYSGIAEGLGLDGDMSYFGRYGSLPIVTVGGPAPNRPDISIDNYQGGRAAAEHLIRDHGRRRIAVLRGPSGHPDADERHRGVMDALRDNGLDRAARLEAELPFEFQRMDEKVAQIVLRWLRSPGPAPDAVVAASDYMALAAIKALKSHGKRVPEDVAVIGFDDVADSQASLPSLSTLRQPFFEMGHKAVELLLGMLDGQPPPERSLMTAQLIRRDSCGCAAASAMPAFGPDAAASLPAVKPEALSKELNLPLPRLLSLLSALKEALEGKAPAAQRSGSFLSLLKECLIEAVQADSDAAAWQDSELMPRLSLAAGTEGGRKAAGETLFDRARLLVAETAQRFEVRQRIELERQSESMRQVSESLITAFDAPLLSETLCERLPKLGFPGFHLSTYEVPQRPAEGARLILSFRDGRRVDLPPEGIPFPTSRLIPGPWPEGTLSLVVEPLYFRDEQIGVLVLEAGPAEGPIYENLRAQISSALQGSKLLEQVRRHAMRLEWSVAERTAELSQTVGRLRTEIAERERAEKALRLASFAIERVSDAIIWIGPDGMVADVNGAACLMLGYGREEIVGAPIADIDSAFRSSSWKEYWERVEKGDGPLRESTLVAKDGREIPVEEMVDLIAFEDKELACAIVRDVSRRKEAELAIQRLNDGLEKRVEERTRQLEAANGELGAFAYSISHDLRAPLRAISGFSKILSEDFAESLPADALPYLDRISRNAASMSQLIDDLLVFSRAGREQMRMEEVDTAALVKAIIANLYADHAALPDSAAATGGSSGVAEFLVEDSLPPCLGDRAMLRQVWTNLISNAVKYSGKRDGARVEIGFSRLEGRTVYRVKDNGVGFDMQWAGKLFGVFQRLHRAEDFEGTGIGLALAKRIIARHGGDIWAEAREGEGATFSFYLGSG